VAGLSRVVLDPEADISRNQRKTLFLARTAAGVSVGFWTPITGIFFALECGIRYLKGSSAAAGVLLDADVASDGPRGDVSAIGVAATAASIVTSLGVQESTLAIQGNSYAMASPVFELCAYLGLGLSVAPFPPHSVDSGTSSPRPSVKEGSLLVCRSSSDLSLAVRYAESRTGPTADTRTPLFTNCWWGGGCS